MSGDKILNFKKLLEKNPKNLLVHYSLANEYFKLERYREAIEAINAYLDLKDDEGAAYRMLGYCYTELGMRQDAKDAYQKGIQAALRHNHPDMAEEFRDSIELLDL